MTATHVYSDSSTHTETRYSEEEEEEVQWMSRAYYQFASTLIITEGIVGVLGNLMVIVVILSSRQLRSNTNNLFIVNLAVCDFLYPIVVTFIIADWNLRPHWMHGDVPCRLHSFAEICMVGVSNLALALYSLVKYVYIAFPLRYEMWISKYTVAVGITLTWLIPLTCSIPVVLAHALEIVWYDPTECFVVVTTRFRALSAIVQFILPVIVILFCGIRVLCIAHAHKKKIALHDSSQQGTSISRRGSWKGVRSYLLLVTFFIVLQGPWMMTAITNAFCHDCVPFMLNWEILPHFMYLSSMVNPFIYLASERRFRRQVIKTLKLENRYSDHETAMAAFTEGM